MKASDFISSSAEISRAVTERAPVVALESTVITHGLPYPQNLEIAREMESIVRNAGALPATVGVIAGRIKVGLTNDELAQLAQSRTAVKVGPRDIAATLVKKGMGGTTVAGTIQAAAHEGIRVFATGGIGGVHRGNATDISPDLQAMADTFMVVVCAGAKAILDLPATLEYLETMGIPVVGYKTKEFPAFYSRSSGLPVSVTLDTPRAIAELAQVQFLVGSLGTVLVVNPVPEFDEIPQQQIEPMIEQAVREAADRKIHGQAVTPFLLQRVSELTARRSERANLALLRNNARLAAEIAVARSAILKEWS
ncbi:MAG TPA: pseudouridine-5'-phosphate glycosidase [Anaerolineales bacterium]|nr:pseudouridine-5'-phosphate glycosidase [Anaerolineales bacterium]